MPNQEIELNPIDFITIGTVGPKGKREFNLQAGKDQQVVTVVLEKQQARQLADAINDMLSDLKEQGAADTIEVNLREWNMQLRDPLEVQFRVARMGLGYDEAHQMIILVAQEAVDGDESGDDEAAVDELDDDTRPSIVRLWGTPEQYKALSDHAMLVVEQGRPDPRQNGHVIYYWT